MISHFQRKVVHIDHIQSEVRTSYACQKDLDLLDLWWIESTLNSNATTNKDCFRSVSWQQQSCPSDLLKSAQCAKSWESMRKYEKVCQKLRRVWENVLIAIFAVQMLFYCSTNEIFWCAVQIFWCAGKKNWECSPNFCREFAAF